MGVYLPIQRSFRECKVERWQFETLIDKTKEMLDEVKFMYWSKSNGYIKFERADGFTWELIKKSK